MSHENKFPGRTHAENKLSVQTELTAPPPPGLSESNGGRLRTLRSKCPKV